MLKLYRIFIFEVAKKSNPYTFDYKQLIGVPSIINGSLILSTGYVFGMDCSAKKS